MILRRTILNAVMLSCAALISTFSAWADNPAVPLQLQADLTIKVMAYAESPAIKAVDVLRIGIVTKGGNADSTQAGAVLKGALDRVDAMGGLAHEQSILQWVDAPHLVEESRRRSLFVLYLMPGLDGEVAAIARALQGIQVITVAATDSYLPDGAILGFELVSGHPKMVFNMTQARQQHVVFRSAVMKLMRIVE
jgi:hypothetical protein